MKQLRALVVTSLLVGSGCALEAGRAPSETTRSPLASAADGTETYVWTRRAEQLLRRLEPALADQPTRNRVLLYGGWTTDGVLADTWEWDGIGWIHRVPAENPGPRFSASTTFDTAQGRALLFGGLGSTAPQLELAPAGLWEWNGTTWARVLTRTTPPARVGASLVWDDKANRAWMFAGGTAIDRSASGEFTIPSDELWTFDGTDWTQIPKTGVWPSARGTTTATWDRARGRMVVHGGYTRLGIADGFLATDLASFQNDTWDWDGTTWTQWANGAIPGEQGAPALAFDPVSNSVSLVAEAPFVSGNTAAIYRGDGTSWTAGPARAPVDIDYDPAVLDKPARNGALAFAKSTWSSANGGFLSVSGLEIVGNVPVGSLYQHDWVSTWDGGWKRYDASLELDKTGSPGVASIGNDVFVFGGLERTAASNTFAFWDGGRWASVVPNGDLPPVRRDPGMAALGTDRIALFGGRAGTNRLKDTWVWTRTPGPTMTGVWSNVSPAAGGPPARYGMMFLSPRRPDRDVRRRDPERLRARRHVVVRRHHVDRAPPGHRSPTPPHAELRARRRRRHPVDRRRHRRERRDRHRLRLLDLRLRRHHAHVDQGHRRLRHAPAPRRRRHRSGPRSDRGLRRLRRQRSQRALRFHRRPWHPVHGPRPRSQRGAPPSPLLSGVRRQPGHRRFRDVRRVLERRRRQPRRHLAAPAARCIMHAKLRVRPRLLLHRRRLLREQLVWSVQHVCGARLAWTLRRTRRVRTAARLRPERTRLQRRAATAASKISNSAPTTTRVRPARASTARRAPACAAPPRAARFAASTAPTICKPRTAPRSVAAPTAARPTSAKRRAPPSTTAQPVQSATIRNSA